MANFGKRMDGRFYFKNSMSLSKKEQTALKHIKENKDASKSDIAEALEKDGHINPNLNEKQKKERAKSSIRKLREEELINFTDNHYELTELGKEVIKEIEKEEGGNKDDKNQKKGVDIAEISTEKPQEVSAVEELANSLPEKTPATIPKEDEEIKEAVDESLKQLKIERAIIKAKLMERLDQARVPTINPDDQYISHMKFGDDNEITHIEDALMLGQNVGLIGPTATGKTLCIETICAKNKWKLRDCTANDLSADEFVGALNLKNMEYVLGDLPKAMINGELLFIDELNFMDQNNASVLFSALNDKTLIISEAQIQLHILPPFKYDSLTDKQKKSGKYIKCHPDFKVASAWNEGYVGTKPLNPALARRFKHKTKFEYLSKAKQEKMLNKRVDSARNRNNKPFTDSQKIQLKEIVKSFVSITEDLRKQAGYGKNINWEKVKYGTAKGLGNTSALKAFVDLTIYKTHKNGKVPSIANLRANFESNVIRNSSGLPPDDMDDLLRETNATINSMFQKSGYPNKLIGLNP